MKHHVPHRVRRADMHDAAILHLHHSCDRLSSVSKNGPLGTPQAVQRGPMFEMVEVGVQRKFVDTGRVQKLARLHLCFE